MILRLILVGLVTSMGFELPSSRDVSSWVESSRAWAYTRTAERSASGLPVAATEIRADYHASDPDGAFQAAQGEILAEFLAPEAKPDAPLVAELAHDSPATFEVAEVVAAGLSDGEEQVVAGLLADAPAVVEPTGLVADRVEPTNTVAEVEDCAVAAEIEDASIEAMAATPTRSDRLATAIRLTREAAQAWAEIIDEPAAAEATASDAIDAR